MTNSNERDLSNLKPREVYEILKNAREYVLKQEGMGTASFLLASLLLKSTQGVGLKMSFTDKAIGKLLDVMAQLVNKGEKNERNNNNN
jgi:hypothetical protein